MLKNRDKEEEKIKKNEENGTMGKFYGESKKRRNEKRLVTLL